MVRWVPQFSFAGVQLTNDEAMSLSTVWACIDIIAKNIGSCAWLVYEPVPGTRRRKVLDTDLRTWLLNTRPNPEMTAIGFREALLFQAIPFGNAYAEIVRDRGGRVMQLWPMLSDRVSPVRVNGELVYRKTEADGSQVVLGQHQVLHLRGPGMWGLMGDNIVARAAKTLGVAAAQERFSASFFGQGAQPVGVLEFPGKLDDKTHARLKQDWADKHKGPSNAFKPLILEAGMKFTATSIDPQKAQLTEDKKFLVEEICRWFGVPPHKVQHLEHATFSNIEHSSIEFVRDALKPWATRLSQEADYKLFDQTRGPWRQTEIDLRPLTLGDAQSRALAQASWRQNGIMTANEIRAQEGLDDCGDEGDILLVQQNMTTVDKILADAEAAEAAAGEAEPDDGPELDITETEPEAEPDDAPVVANVIKAALNSSLSRYDRRVKNRLASLDGKPISVKTISLLQFKNTQLSVIHNELQFFNEFFMSALGREVSHDDVKKLVDAFERGGERHVDVLNALISSSVHTK